LAPAAGFSWPTASLLINQAAAKASEIDKMADQNLMANSTQEVTPQVSGKEGKVDQRIPRQSSRKPSASIDLR